MRLRVSIAGDDRATIIETSSSDPTVGELKDGVFKARSPALTPRKHRLRIIIAGRLLMDDSMPLRIFGDMRQRVVHCAVSEIQEKQGRPDPDALKLICTESQLSGLPRPRLHGLVAILARDAIYVLSRYINNFEAALQSLAYEMEDVARSMHGQDFEDLALSTVEQGPSVGSGELERIAMTWNEEDSEPSFFVDWLSGCMLGFFLGFIMLIVSMDRTISFPRNWIQGVRLGVVCNTFFGLYLMMSNEFI